MHPQVTETKPKHEATLPDHKATMGIESQGKINLHVRMKALFYIFH